MLKLRSCAGAATPLGNLGSPLGATFTFGEGEFQRHLAEMQTLDAATFLAGPAGPSEALQAPARQPSRLGPARLHDEMPQQAAAAVSPGVPTAVPDQSGLCLQ